MGQGEVEPEEGGPRSAITLGAERLLVPPHFQSPTVSLSHCITGVRGSCHQPGGTMTARPKSQSLREARSEGLASSRFCTQATQHGTQATGARVSVTSARAARATGLECLPTLNACMGSWLFPLSSSGDQVGSAVAPQKLTSYLTPIRSANNTHEDGVGTEDWPLPTHECMLNSKSRLCVKNTQEDAVAEGHIWD